MTRNPEKPDDIAYWYRISALVNLAYRYLTWAHGGGMVAGDDPPLPEPELHRRAD